MIANLLGYLKELGGSILRLWRSTCSVDTVGRYMIVLVTKDPEAKGMLLPTRP